MQSLTRFVAAAVRIGRSATIETKPTLINGKSGGMRGAFPLALAQRIFVLLPSVTLGSATLKSHATPGSAAPKCSRV
jgi:hypothetical protein